MRFLVLTLVLMLSMFLVGCDDGEDKSYANLIGYVYGKANWRTGIIYCINNSIVLKGYGSDSAFMHLIGNDGKPMECNKFLEDKAQRELEARKDKAMQEFERRRRR